MTFEINGLVNPAGKNRVGGMPLVLHEGYGMNPGENTIAPLWKCAGKVSLGDVPSTPAWNPVHYLLLQKWFISLYLPKWVKLLHSGIKSVDGYVRSFTSRKRRLQMYGWMINSV